MESLKNLNVENFETKDLEKHGHLSEVQNNEAQDRKDLNLVAKDESVKNTSEIEPRLNAADKRWVIRCGILRLFT